MTKKDIIFKLAKKAAITEKMIDVSLEDQEYKKKEYRRVWGIHAAAKELIGEKAYEKEYAPLYRGLVAKYELEELETLTNNPF